jgi:hypothetical protein
MLVKTLILCQFCGGSIQGRPTGAAENAGGVSHIILLSDVINFDSSSLACLLA